MGTGIGIEGFVIGVAGFPGCSYTFGGAWGWTLEIC